MVYRRKIIVLSIISISLAMLYIFYDLTGNIAYILPRRVIKVLVIMLTGGGIAFSTTIFMTITHNRILTPSVMGLDSLYLLIQVFISFIFGSQSLVMMSSNINYLLSVGIMILFSFVLFRLLFRGENNNIYSLLLIGVIL